MVNISTRVGQWRWAGSWPQFHWYPSQRSWLLDSFNLRDLSSRYVIFCDVCYVTRQIWPCGIIIGQIWSLIFRSFDFVIPLTIFYYIIETSTCINNFFASWNSWTTVLTGFIAVREMSGRNKISQGQGIVREFCKVSGKFWHLAKLMKNVMEFHIMSGKMTILDNMTPQSPHIVTN